MATPTQSEMLTGAEAHELTQMFANEVLMSGLQKVLNWEQKLQHESTENEALKADPNIYRILQSASRARTAREFFDNLKARMTALIVRQR